MVQSSGTGKSRTVHEGAAKVFTLAFNIREKTKGEDGKSPILFEFYLLLIFLQI